MNQFTLLVIIGNLLEAMGWTIVLSLLAFIGGGLFGLIILLFRVSQNFALELIAKIYIEFLQGTPLLMQIFLLFFGLALFGMELSPLVAATLALSLWAGAFLAEIWRGCVEALPKGQFEGSKALALTYLQTMRLVILPQALRLATAPTVGFSVQLVKGTALASIIGFVELTKAGTLLNNATYRPFLVYSLVAIFYFILCYPLSYCAKRLEAKFRAQVKR